MSEPVKISARDARARMRSSNPPLLVLAYEDDSKFATLALDGAISFSDFRKRQVGLPKDKEIILYCA